MQSRLTNAHRGGVALGGSDTDRSEFIATIRIPLFARNCELQLRWLLRVRPHTPYRPSQVCLTFEKKWSSAKA